LKNNNICVNVYVISHESLFLENTFLIHTNRKADMLFVCLFGQNQRPASKTTRRLRKAVFECRVSRVTCHVSRWQHVVMSHELTFRGWFERSGSSSFRRHCQQTRWLLTLFSLDVFGATITVPWFVSKYYIKLIYIAVSSKSMTVSIIATCIRL